MSVATRKATTDNFDSAFEPLPFARPIDITAVAPTNDASATHKYRKSVPVWTTRMRAATIGPAPSTSAPKSISLFRLLSDSPMVRSAPSDKRGHVDHETVPDVRLHHALVGV